jgi:ubiquitin-like 1-activating enzyme E1 B
MAGNIIPAIATANAIIAGQIVIHALRALSKNYERCQSVFLRAKPNHKGAILVKDKKLESPNPNCFVCSVHGELILRLDTTRITVRQLDELILKKKLNMVLPDVMADNRILISSNEDDELDLYSFSLNKIQVVHGSRLKVDDYFQNYSVIIMIHHKEKATDEQPDFEIFNNMEDLRKRDEQLIAEENAKIVQETYDCVIEEFEKDDYRVDKVKPTYGSIRNEQTDTDMMETIDSEHEVSDAKESLTDSGDQEVSNEEILALKRKSGNEEETSEPKKSRFDE